MTMRENNYSNKRIVESKLDAFGFKKEEFKYTYSQNIVNDQFKIELVVKDGKLTSKLVDITFGDEYVLHLVPDAQGEFVGNVRAEYNAVLDRFYLECCEKDVFKSPQARAVIDYVRVTYGDELEFLWEKVSDNAVFRRKDTQSWYAAMLIVAQSKLGGILDEKVEIINLRMLPEQVQKAVNEKLYLPAYHMNKKHWVTIVLDGSTATEEIYCLIDDSYKLANKKSGRSRRGAE